MGLLAPTDWQGDWIAAETALLREDRQAGLQWMRGPAGTGNRRAAASGSISTCPRRRT
jgi:hypothetical protein